MEIVIQWILILKFRFIVNMLKTWHVYSYGMKTKAKMPALCSKSKHLSMQYDLLGKQSALVSGRACVYWAAVVSVTGPGRWGRWDCGWMFPPLAAPSWAWLSPHERSVSAELMGPWLPIWSDYSNIYHSLNAYCVSTLCTHFSVDLCSNLMRLLLTLTYRWGNWDSEELINKIKVV